MSSNDEVKVWGHIEYWQRVPDKAPQPCSGAAADLAKAKVSGSEEFVFELPSQSAAMKRLTWALDAAAQAGARRARAEVREALGMQTDPWNGIHW